MRVLKIATVVMGVLIVGGTALLALLIVRRITPMQGAAREVSLREPPGTKLIGLAAVSSGIAVALQGGGPDRILILDPRTLHETRRVTLTP